MPIFISAFYVGQLVQAAADSQSAYTRSLTLNSSFHFRPSRATHQSRNIPDKVNSDLH
jgi:hypothetical protein